MSSSKIPAKDNVYVGLDVGTTKVRAAVLRVNYDGGYDLIGLGSAPCTGITKGIVSHMESTVKSIKTAISDAERMCGVTIKSVCTGISGSHIKGFNSRGIIAVRQGEVTANDVQRVLESASAINIPVGHEVLHVMPQQFILDNHTDIKDPVGMSGVRLEVEVHIVIGAVASAANITKACVQAGYEVEDVFLEQLAASEAVLTEDEKEIGVCILDGGGGTTDMAVFNKGSVQHTAVLQLGGMNFTRDLSIGLNTSEGEAEKVKLQHGCVWMDMVGSEDIVEVASVGGRALKKVSKPVVTQILQSRAEEIFLVLLGELNKKNLMEAISGGGVVITGGMGNFDGICELAKSIIGTNVYVGYPRNIGGLSDMVADPMYATAVGLAMLHAKKGHSKNAISTGSDDRVFGNIFKKMAGWFNDFF